MASERLFTIQEANALFKIKYEKLSENVYNSANVLLGRVKKSYNFVGEKIQITIPSSFSGGVGSGKLPKANTAIYKRAELEAKKMYAVVELDRETIKAALKDEGSFVRATKEVVKKGVESFMRNMSRTLFNDGSGKLGLVSEVKELGYDSVTGAEQVVSTDGVASGVTDSSDGTTLIVATKTQVKCSNFKEANFEERDLINVLAASASAVKGAGGVDTLHEIDEVRPDAQAIIILGAIEGNGAGQIEAGDSLVMQGSLNNDPEGLKGVLQKSDGRSSSYTIDHGRRWEAVVEDADKQSISTDMLNKVMLKIKKKCGKSPNLIVTSFKQYERILNLLESQKRYTVPTRAGLKSKSGADISFSGVEFMSIDGPIGIFPERFVEDDTIYLLNDAHIHIHHRPDFGWFDDDGTVFLRKADADAYEARYGGYLQTYINPAFHGVITDLANDDSEIPTP